MSKIYSHHLGIDLHKRFAYWTLMNDAKEVLYQQTVVTTEAAVRVSCGAFAALGIEPHEVQCAIEPVSEWGWYSDLLLRLGFHVKLVDVYKSKLIAGTRLKNDKVDSKILAEMLRSDFLPEAYLAPLETRTLRELLRWRIFLVRIRARLKNKGHSIMTRYGLLCPQTDMYGVGGRRWFETQHISDVYDRERASLLRLYDAVTPEIKSVSADITLRAERDETTRILTSIPGIGAFTAMVMLSEIGTFERFPSPEKLACFAGLVASSYSSGGKVRLAGITKRGSPHLRWVMIEATNTVRPSWGHLYSFYERIKKKKGSKVARVALARKMLTIAWHLVKRKEPFQAQFLSHRSFRQREAVFSSGV